MQVLVVFESESKSGELLKEEERVIDPVLYISSTFLQATRAMEAWKAERSMILT